MRFLNSTIKPKVINPHDNLVGLQSPKTELKPKAAIGLVEHLKARIEVVGALTVADYIREVLTNPTHGYYMKGDVFGSEGDFITSPEISQIFGELVGVWHVAQWMAMGKPQNVQLIELGPGRATMMQDVLRTMDQFGMTESVSIHLVEASQALRKLQAKTLNCDVESHISSGTQPNDELQQSVVADRTTRVHWYGHLEEIPLAEKDGYCMIIGHEFF